jgi:LPXTG-site transpeptidase (sortase) family protein
MKVEYKRRSSIKIWPILLAFVLLVLIFLFYLIRDDGRPDISSTQTDNQVQSANPADSQSPNTSRGAPSRIIIPSVEIDALIISVGLTSTGQMDAPNSLTDVGWYNRSSEVGEGTYSILLDGHYGRPGRPGVFFNLKDIKLGDDIELFGQMSDGVVYKVVEIENLPQEDVDMRKALMPYSDGAESITLITCFGDYDYSNADYSHRVVVYAQKMAE